MVSLAGLDLSQGIKRRLNRAFLQVTMALLSVVLVAMVLSSLSALLQITKNVQSLIGDAMVGVETAMSMRSAIRETRLDLLHLRLENGLRISAREVQILRQNFTRLLADYREGALEDQDKANALQIAVSLDFYATALEPLVDNSQPETKAIEAADEAADVLVDKIERAYEYNRSGLHENARAANVAAKKALQVSIWLCSAFAVIMTAMALIFLIYRWLEPPEEREI